MVLISLSYLKFNYKCSNGPIFAIKNGANGKPPQNLINKDLPHVEENAPGYDNPLFQHGS
jgi:hypothetical protein